MAISTITINTIDYISYASVIDADARLAIDPIRGAAWALLSEDEKGGALVSATYRLDLLLWQGARTNGALQPNAWPRINMRHCDGTPTVTDDVPLDVETATILQAGSIVLDPGTADAGGSGTNIKAVGAGSTSVEFFQPKTGGPIQDITVHSLLRCFLESSVTGGGATGNYAPGSGADAPKSCFTEKEPFGLGKGYA